MTVAYRRRNCKSESFFTAPAQTATARAAFALSVTTLVVYGILTLRTLPAIASLILRPIRASSTATKRSICKLSQNPRPSSTLLGSPMIDPPSSAPSSRSMVVLPLHCGPIMTSGNGFFPFTTAISQPHSLLRPSASAKRNSANAFPVVTLFIFSFLSLSALAGPLWYKSCSCSCPCSFVPFLFLNLMPTRPRGRGRGDTTPGA